MPRIDECSSWMVLISLSCQANGPFLNRSFLVAEICGGDGTKGAQGRDTVEPIPLEYPIIE